MAFDPKKVAEQYVTEAKEGIDDAVGDVKKGWRFLRSVWFWIIAGPVNMIVTSVVIAWAFPFIFLGFPEPPEELKGVKKAIVIDKDKQAAYAYENGKLKHRFVILTGDGEHDTPTGKFKVDRKVKDHFSGEYKAPMPNSLFFINYRGIATHASFAVGFKWTMKHFSGGHPYIGSHGCVRMTPLGSARLFKFADVNTPLWVMADMEKNLVDAPVAPAPSSGSPAPATGGTSK